MKTGNDHLMAVFSAETILDAPVACTSCMHTVYDPCISSELNSLQIISKLLAFPDLEW